MNVKIKQVFEKYFDTNFWNNSESKSGDGSTLQVTQEILRVIPELLKKYSIKSMLDIPCGDLNWMKHVEVENYIGADIVEILIKDLKKKYPDRTFQCLDITSDKLPQVDLILTRDCLVHLPFKEVFKAINNIINSKSKYLLVTTFCKHIDNRNIELGKWTSMNLQVKPYCFPKPVELLLENCKFEGFSDKCLGLWKIRDLKRYE